MIPGITAGGPFDSVPPFVIPDSALVHKNAGETYGTGGTIMDWQVEDYDRGGWHDPAVNNSRLTVPSGVDLVRYGGNCKTQAASNRNNLAQLKNGASFFGRGWNQTNPNTGVGAVNAWSAPTPVVPSDYFEYSMITSSGTATPNVEDYTWAAIEALDSALRFALVGKTANQALAASTPTALSWLEAGVAGAVDTDGFHSDAVDPSRLSVPAGSGIALVRLSGNLLESGGSNILAEITKNGATARGLPARQQGSGSADPINLVSAPIEVIAGTDFFEMLVTLSSATSINFGDSTWFCIEEVEQPPTYQRVLLYKTALQSLAAGVDAVLTWAAAEYDTAGVFNIADPTVVTVPAGVTQARASYSLAGTTQSNGFAGYVKKNAGDFHGTPRMNSNQTALGGRTCAMGAWVDVVPGDELELWAESSAARDVLAHNSTWFCVEFR